LLVFRAMSRIDKFFMTPVTTITAITSTLGSQ
jgi:hypothetical protein